MVKRIISSLALMPFLLVILLTKGVWLYLGTLVVSLVGQYEFYRAFNHSKFKPITMLGYVATVIYFGGLYFNVTPVIMSMMIVLFVLSMLVTFLFNQQSTLEQVAVTLLGFFYVPFLLSHITMISHIDTHGFMWLIFIIAWGTDTFAYFVGKLFGRNKLIEEISPNKTVEGAIGGVVGSTALTVAFAEIFIPGFTMYAIVLGIIGGIISQLGDLIASRMKRYTGVKDFGKIIPGHGGVLDRFDSILMTAPLVFYFLSLYVTMK